MNKVIVAGASGVVGLSAVEHFASLDGWEVVGVSRRPPASAEGRAHVALDIGDAAACRAFASANRDVTHVVYAAVYEKPGLVRGWYERDQMDRNDRMLRNFLQPLSDLADGLRHVSLLQGTKAYGVHLQPIAVPARERRSRHPHENFYWLQEDFLRAAQEKAGWAFTILRPQVVFGRALGSNMNPIPALGAYAALLRERGEPLYFPGEPLPFVFEAVDAELLAGALAWAATAREARDETFNVTNGDVMVWANVWPTIAEPFGMEPAESRPISFADDMPARQLEWERLVAKYDLRAPRSLLDFAGQSFHYLDFLFARGAEHTPQPALVSTTKIRQAGFGDSIDTEDMLRKWLRRFQAERLLPPLEPMSDTISRLSL
jgi:nucleoside-diphosphate-sugar epimerase